MLNGFDVIYECDAQKERQTDGLYLMVLGVHPECNFDEIYVAVRLNITSRITYSGP